MRNKEKESGTKKGVRNKKRTYHKNKYIDYQFVL